jgi:hypothetical protein
MVQEFKSVSELLEFLNTNSMTQEEIVAALETINSTKPASGQRRGQLAGLTVEEMSDEQLKREVINSNSVLYKAKQRGASAETIAKNQDRVDAVQAEKAKRTPAVVAPTDDAAPETVYSEDVAAEL